MGNSASKKKPMPSISEEKENGQAPANGEKGDTNIPEFTDSSSSVTRRPKKAVLEADPAKTQSKRISFYEQVDATEVLPFLLIGNLASVKSEDFITRKGVKFVLNLTDSHMDMTFPGVEYKTVTLEDDDEQELLPFLDECFTFIDKARPKGTNWAPGAVPAPGSATKQQPQSAGKVLVNSYFGISRTSALALAYLMKTYGWTLRSSFYHLKERNPSASPNEGFIIQLLRYDQMLNNGAMSMTLQDFYQ
eukprot:Em0006g1315a